MWKYKNQHIKFISPLKCNLLLVGLYDIEQINLWKKAICFLIIRFEIIFEKKLIKIFKEIIENYVGEKCTKYTNKFTLFKIISYILLCIIQLIIKVLFEIRKRA